MLKKRVTATLVVRNGIVVQSINFKRYLPVGKPPIAVEFLNQWGVDEIILLDISASENKREPDYELVKRASMKCQVPLTVGGGITQVDHIKELMRCGADKISLNQAAIHDPDLITEAAKIFGDQCVVVAIDAVKTKNGYSVYDYINCKALNIDPAEFAGKSQSLGAGELYINSVDRDGSYLGYDIDLIKSVCETVSVPVICSGGALNARDFIKVFSETEVSAASAANLYHFTEHSVNTIKANIQQHFDIRLDTHADYEENTFHEDLRLKKKEDRVLEDMLYIRIEKEVI